VVRNSLLNKSYIHSTISKTKINKILRKYGQYEGNVQALDNYHHFIIYS